MVKIDDTIEDKFEDACERYFNATSKKESKTITKKLFAEMIECFKEDGGFLQLYPFEIYKNVDIVDLNKAKKVLSNDLYDLVVSLSNQLEGNNDYVYDESNAPLMNYEAYCKECSNIALNFVMLTGTTTFINSKYLQNIEKKSFDRDLEYMENSKKLVQDNMVYSNQWRILFRHYKKEVYDLYTEEWLGDIEYADYQDYEKILFDIISNSPSFGLDEEEMENNDYEYFTKYGLKDYYPLPNKKNKKD